MRNRFTCLRGRKCSFPALKKHLYFPLEGSKYTECQRDIEDDSRESWAHSAVESEWTFLRQYLFTTICKPRIFVRVNSLHPRFDNIDWIVGKHRHSSGESACYQVAEYLGGDDVLKLLGGLRVNQESNTLISRLFKQSSCITLINTSNTICFNYFVNTVPYVSVLWSRLKLIMDELCFESLLRCDDEGGLGCACYEPTAEVVNSALVWEELRLSDLVRTKANIILGDGE